MNERACTAVRRQDHGEKVIDGIDVGDQLGTSRDVFSSNAKAHLLVNLEIQLPFPTARREQRVAVSDVTHELAVGSAGVATDDEGKHETLADIVRHSACAVPHVTFPESDQTPTLLDHS